MMGFIISTITSCRTLGKAGLVEPQQQVKTITRTALEPTQVDLTTVEEKATEGWYLECFQYYVSQKKWQYKEMC